MEEVIAFHESDFSPDVSWIEYRGMHALLWRPTHEVTGVITTRQGIDGATLDLSHGREDDRRQLGLLLSQLEFRGEVHWLQQVHQNTCVRVDAQPPADLPCADAAYSAAAHVACAVLSADCVPILLASPLCGIVAAIHAGWRGLACGVIASTIDTINAAGDTTTNDWLSLIAPCISQPYYEVDDAVYRRFDADAHAAFIARGADKWLMDLGAIATMQLRAAGVDSIVRVPICTFASPQWFYSARRDGDAGRFASLVWRAE